jgi:hypothetical protein
VTVDEYFPPDVQRRSSTCSTIGPRCTARCARSSSWWA